MPKEQESILVVDDEGYHCQEARNAEQALDKLRNNTVSLVILDIRMPGKRGW